jgi:hypothetical protein
MVYSVHALKAKFFKSFMLTGGLIVKNVLFLLYTVRDKRLSELFEKAPKTHVTHVYE